MQKIILIGYMAVGKTTIGKQLAEKMQIEAIDLDSLIEKETELSIPEIFEQKGEVYFRKIEHKIFTECVESDKDLIISTGGGTPCYYNNHELLKNDNCISIYLKASVPTLFHRLRSGKNKRPLLANLSQEELQEYIAKHLFDRSYYYHQAQHIVTVDDKTVTAIVAEIKALLT